MREEIVMVLLSMCTFWKIVKNFKLKASEPAHSLTLTLFLIGEEMKETQRQKRTKRENEITTSNAPTAPLSMTQETT
jgi:hypothetical protein